MNVVSDLPGKCPDYNYHREYDPGIGRYVESDPIGLRGGINTYAYVFEDPVMSEKSNGLTRRGDGSSSAFPPGADAVGRP